EINTLDAADVINLRDFFNVSGELLITQVGELSGFDDIRSSGNIIVNDDNIGSRAGIIAIGTGTLSGTGALSQFTVEAGASRQLTSDFKLNNSFELAGGGEITGNFNLILAASGRLNFTGTVSNMEINDVSGGRGIRMQSIFNLTGNLTITQVAGLSGEDFRVGGNITITDNAVGGSALLVLVGSGNTIFQGAGNGDYLDMAIEKDNSTDKVQLNSSDTFREITIRNGILDINGQSPTVDLVIEGGGTLAGSGAVNGFVDGLDGSTISPGNSAGTLTIDGDVTIPGTLIMEIFGNGENNGGTAGTDFDQLVVTGQADIGTLSVLFMGTVGPSFPTSGDSYTLLDSPSVLVGGISISPSYINVSYSAGVIFILSPALPIELLYFNASAKGQAVLLQWATATEHNNDYMAVERSADGVRFTEIGRVLGAGTTQEPREYHFTDDSPLPGLNYYRLRQVDFDGRAEYHKVISILFEGKGANLGLQAFPNPAHSNLQARWSPNSTLGTTLSLMDLNGHLLAEYRIPAGTGSHELQLGHLPSGTYFLRATQKDHTEVLRVVKR
ncbi:MAG: T9SS type A sorting domain-containing protein, partial [Lewinellaceae bacterium]|nr:T9SS type A sorting domain-containing protein [Lewinellaceae bacterium]